VADGLTPAAWAEDDVLEAVELAGRRFCVGVQWHPEAGADHRVFGALVAAARQPIA
jgi:gamma-glutamyl-gamma-aminobutyrate hydrolase PuuD